MIVSVVTPSAAAVVPLDVAKAHLNVDFADHDDLIEAYVAAATATIDGPDGWLGRSLGEQTLEVRLDGFGCEDLLALPCGPILSIVSIKYDDAAGAEQTLTVDSDFSLDPQGVLVAFSATWPAARRRRGSVRIRYTAGYPDGIPKPIAQAILLMTGDLYATRETAVVGLAAAKVPMSLTVENLLAPFRLGGRV